MDGTVMDTDVDYVKLARIVEDEFESLGIPEDVIEQDRKMDSMQHGIEWLKVHKPEAVDGLEDRINDRATAVECEHADVARPIPGAVELIEKLRSKGYKVAILTRGGRYYANLIMGNSGILGLFDAMVARDDYPRNEAKPNRKSMEHLCERLGVGCDEILFVGDSVVDWRTAVNSGSQFIGVETGHTKRPDWEKAAGRDVHIVNSVADIIGLI